MRIGLNSNYVKEHDAWINMFEEIRKAFNLSKEELNKEEYKPIFKAVEKWGYWDFKRRLTLKEENNPRWNYYGLFWKGEEENGFNISPINNEKLSTNNKPLGKNEDLKGGA